MTPGFAAPRPAEFAALTRPVFLLGGFLFYALGAAFAGVWPGVGRYLLGQALVTCVQLATQYANEVFDVETDAANDQRTWLSGGSGVLVDGRVSVGVAERAALGFASVSLLLAGWLLFVEPAVAAIGAVALLGGWYYSAPPIRLAGSGLGELEASLIVVVLTPLAGTLMASGAAGPALAWAGGGLVLVHVAMLLGVHLPDHAADAATGKRTLVVRGGPSATRLAIPVLVAAGIGLLLWAGATGRLPGLAGWGALAGVVPGAAFGGLALSGSTRWSWLTTAAVATVSATGAGLTLGALL